MYTIRKLIIAVPLVCFACAEKTAELSGKFLSKDDQGIRKMLVQLTIDGKTQTVDTVASCATLPPSEFATYDIPKDAVSAVGGWRGGVGGDYFYIRQENEQVILYYGWQAEGQEGNGFHWKEKQRF